MYFPETVFDKYSEMNGKKLEIIGVRNMWNLILIMLLAFLDYLCIETEIIF